MTPRAYDVSVVTFYKTWYKMLLTPNGKSKSAFQCLPLKELDMGNTARISLRETWKVTPKLFEESSFETYHAFLL